MAKEHLYAHAKRRCQERYNLELTRSNYQQILGMIEREQGVLVRNDPKRKSSIWLIAFKGMAMKVVYDHRERSIATFLPFDSAQDKPLNGTAPN